MDLRLLKKVRCRFLDRATGIPVPKALATLSVEVGDLPRLIQIPVATLCTDATGYISFDLKPLIDIGLPIVSGLFITAPQFGLTNYDLLGSLTAAPSEGGKREPLPIESQGRQLQWLVFPIYLNRSGHDVAQGGATCESTRLPSIQSPDACDYTVSPFSFVTPTALKLGTDCCEILLPSSLPIQRYRFYKIVARRGPVGEGEPEEAPQGRVNVVDNLEESPRANDIKFADILEYRQDWYSLGHALGEIKYSLPLAPGESTQLAVIEWSRNDLASRTDTIRATEFLDHDSRRERVIEETVEAALREEQGGNAHMGGTSGTATGSQYVNWTGNHAFGGGISYSYGKRDLEGESLQDLHDRVRQASSSVRSIYSTVVVQASQAEQNTLQTRRVANHNHCHALTIQYYEVLRHYRLSTEFVGRRKAVLIPFTPFSFSWELALRFRTILEKALLDPSLKECFEALIRIHLAPSVYDDPQLTIDKPVPETETQILLKAPEGTGKAVTIKNLKKGDKIAIVAQGLIAMSGGNGPGSGGLSPDGSLEIAGTMGGFDFLANGLRKFSLIYKLGLTGIWRQGGRAFDIHAENDGDNTIVFGVNNLPNAFVDFGVAGATGWTIALKHPLREPAVSPTDPSRDKEPLFRKGSDLLCEARLLSHLAGNRAFYNSAVWMLMDAVERRLYLQDDLRHLPNILDGIEDRPFAISGSHVAFRFTGPQDTKWDTLQAEDPQGPLEDILTLPTRGLFAEAQMGHCNSCEKRDVTRMWNWTEMTAETPPEIGGISPGPKGTAPSIAQGQLPNNVIQITTPEKAPDPTGLANALAVLKTPEIFRDMAGLEEVSKLLGELAKASGDANSKALALQAKEKVDEIKKPAESSALPAGASGVSAADAADRFSLLPEIKSFAKDIGLTDDEYKKFALDYVGGTQAKTKPTGDKVTPAVPGVERVVLFFSTFPGTSNPIFGLYDFGIREPISGRETSSSFFIKVGSAIGRIPVQLPAGLWELQGRIEAQIPESTLTVPVTVVPGLNPFDFKAQEDLATASIPMDVAGTIAAKTSAKVIEVQLDALFETVSVEREIELSIGATGSAQLTSEAKASVEAEANVHLVDLTGRGELAFGTQYVLSGTAQAGQKLKLTISYRRLTGFKLTQK